jgi:hypothetical protein
MIPHIDNEKKSILWLNSKTQSGWMIAYMIAEKLKKINHFQNPYSFVRCWTFSGWIIFSSVRYSRAD